MSNGHKGPFPEWNMEGMMQSQAQGEGPIAEDFLNGDLGKCPRGEKCS